jgi:predicted TIM-barrel fold metal-dependent hydrolase
MFGSDHPFAGAEYLAYEIKKVKCLDLSQEDEDNILGGSIAKLLKISIS